MLGTILCGIPGKHIQVRSLRSVQNLGNLPFCVASQSRLEACFAYLSFKTERKGKNLSGNDLCQKQKLQVEVLRLRSVDVRGRKMCSLICFNCIAVFLKPSSFSVL